MAAAPADSSILRVQNLDIAKSAADKSIARLEERLGLKLFNRATRRTSLTVGEAQFAVGSIDDLL